MNSERNLGPQPLGTLMLEHELTNKDLVAASTEQITHKMVNRAVRGRRLSPSVMTKIRNALNLASGRHYALEDLFTYRG